VRRVAPEAGTGANCLSGGPPGATGKVQTVGVDQRSVPSLVPGRDGPAIRVITSGIFSGPGRGRDQFVRDGLTLKIVLGERHQLDIVWRLNFSPIEGREDRARVVRSHSSDPSRHKPFVGIVSQIERRSRVSERIELSAYRTPDYQHWRLTFIARRIPGIPFYLSHLLFPPARFQGASKQIFLEAAPAEKA
jgi:hypothetical protein